MPATEKKRISCKRCQTRKIKCTRTAPCRSCENAGVACVFRASDWKRAPVSTEYVSALENNVAALESLLSNIVSAPLQDRDRIIDGLDFVDHLSSTAQNRFLEMPEGVWDKTEQGSPVYYGPCSALGSRLLRNPKVSLKTSQEPNVFNKISRIPNIIIKECIKLFFFHQHPYSSLIDQNTFMRDLDNNSSFDRALTYAICSLGSLMFDDQNIKGLSILFATSSEQIFMAQCWTPSIDTSRAMLLCAVFHLGRGNYSKAWMLSGMAFRMAQDLGLHESNQPLASAGLLDASLSDIESRRCISWIYYQSVKIFSLFFGRPALTGGGEYLKIDSTPSSVSSGSSPCYSDFAADLGQNDLAYTTFIQQQTFQDSYGIDPSAIPTFSLKQLELSKIIHNTQSFILSSRSTSTDGQNYGTEAQYTRINTRLNHWHNTLPSEMRWSKWCTNLEPVDQSLATLHMLYHIARITLHRHRTMYFESIPWSLNHSELLLATYKICDDSIDVVVDILRRFRAQNSLRNASLIFVQAAVAAVDALFNMPPYRESSEGSELALDSGPLLVLDEALTELANAWEIANHLKNGIRAALEQKRRISGSVDSINSTPSNSTGVLSDMTDIQIHDSTIHIIGSDDFHAPDYGCFAQTTNVGYFEDLGVHLL